MKIWFQNRRYKTKRRQLHAENSLPASARKVAVKVRVWRTLTSSHTSHTRTLSYTRRTASVHLAQHYSIVRPNNFPNSMFEVILVCCWLCEFQEKEGWGFGLGLLERMKRTPGASKENVEICVGGTLRVCDTNTHLHTHTTTPTHTHTTHTHTHNSTLSKVTPLFQTTHKHVHHLHVTSSAPQVLVKDDQIVYDRSELVRPVIYPSVPVPVPPGLHLYWPYHPFSIP